MYAPENCPTILLREATLADRNLFWILSQWVLLLIGANLKNVGFS